VNIGIGLGCDEDAAKAASDAVRHAKKAVPRPDLALVFGSIYLDQARVHQALCKEIDPNILIGGTSYREITAAGVTRGTVAVLLLSLEGAKLRFSSAETAAKRYDTGVDLAKGIPGRVGGPGRLPLGLVFSSAASGNETEMLRAISDRLGPVPCFGGMYSGDYDLGMSHPDVWVNHQYSGSRLTRGTTRLAVLDLPADGYEVAFGFGHGWQSVGPVTELTRCEGEKVFEVGGMPVFDYYRQFLGGTPCKDFFEHMIQRFAFSVLAEGGRSRVKLPVACDFEKGCISYYPSEDLQSRRVQLIQANRQGLLTGAKEASSRCLEALGGPPSLVIVVSCCLRSSILHSKVDTEFEVIRDVFGKDVPLFGYYSGGEMGPILSPYAQAADPNRAMSGSFSHAATLCILGIRAKSAGSVVVPEKSAADCAGSPEEENARLTKMLRKSEDIFDSTESFLASLSRKSYEDGERLRKQNEIIFRYTPHQVFRKVGDSVSRGEYEVPDAEFQGAFMFMDVKGFTSYTEAHGSAEVVRALNEIFAPSTDIIYECGGDVDKYIGDCIFAAFEKGADAIEAGRRILGLFEGLRSRDNPFTVRIGINAGRAVRANVGSTDRREYTYIGDAVNLTQRLESNCTPGKMLVGEAVFKGIAPPEGADRREITVKGKKQAVTAYELSA